MNRRTKKERGITLIALVITIIVLLILAGVSIAMLTGDNGILTKATEAKRETEKAEEDEKVRLAITSAMDNNGNFNKEAFIEELKKQGIEEKNIASYDDDGNIIVTTTNKEYVINKEGKIENTTDTENMFSTLLANKVHIGDYVAYNATNDYSYTSEKGTGSSNGNGSEKQTITSSSDIKWRVFSKNVATGEVILISEEPIGNFKLYGAVGYLYSEQELNNACAVYGHGIGADTSKQFDYEVGDYVEGVTAKQIEGSGARSINCKDINEICKFDPTKHEYYGQFFGKQPYPKEIRYPTTKTELGYSNSLGMRNDTYTYYMIKGSDYLDSNSSIYKILFKDKNSDNDVSYWLSTRTVAVRTTENAYSSQMVRDGVYDRKALFFGYGSTSVEEGDYGLRPIVYLKTTLKTNGKNSNGTWTIQE